MRYLILLTLLSLPAFADSTTFICKNADGTKAIQDRPCSALQEHQEVRNAKTNSPPPTASNQILKESFHRVTCSNFARQAIYNDSLYRAAIKPKEQALYLARKRAVEAKARDYGC